MRRLPRSTSFTRLRPVLQAQQSHFCPPQCNDTHSIFASIHSIFDCEASQPAATLSQCFVRASFRTAIARRCLAAMIAHESSGQFLGSLLSDQSTPLLHVTVAGVTILRLLLLNFNSRGSLECERYQIPPCTRAVVRDVFVQHTWQPA